MRIFVVHNLYQQPGGEDTVFEGESRLLEEHGHEVIRYTAHNNEVKGLSRIQLLREAVWNKRRGDELRNLIAAAQPDIIHVHNTFMRISPAVYWAAAECHVPVVQTVHNYRLICLNALLLRDQRPCEDCVGKMVAWPGVIHGCYRSSRTASAAVAAMLALHRMWGTWNTRVERYIALTEFAKRMMVEGGIEPGRIVVKPNMLNPDPGAGQGNGAYCLFVGRLATEKGIGVLLSAWRKIGKRLGISLTIVGDGPEAPLVRSAAAEDDTITWLGFQPAAVVKKLMGEAMFLVFPSIWYEGMPMTVLEAFAKGTPVIASDIGALTDIVENGKTGLLFSPGDAADLASRMTQMADAPNARAAMRIAARDEFEQNYTADINYGQLMNIYQQCIHDVQLVT